MTCEILQRIASDYLSQIDLEILSSTTPTDMLPGKYHAWKTRSHDNL